MSESSQQNAELLIEIFTEELPAFPLLQNLDSIKQSWIQVLKQFSLESCLDLSQKSNLKSAQESAKKSITESKKNTSESFFKLHFTPRRLTLIHRHFPLKTRDEIRQVYGAPLSIAFNSSGEPTQAALSFFKKNNIAKITRDELKNRIQNNVKTAIKDGKEVLFYEEIKNGVESSKILKTMVESWLKSLNFGKSMRWGDVKEDFIRPIRNICILFDKEFLPCDIFGVKSEPKIAGHRQAVANHKKVGNLDEYLSFLRHSGVILNQEERRDRILAQIRKIESENGVNVEIDPEILEEIVAITEYPNAILGSFDARFLQVPREMIVTSMKENQRYFAVYKNGEILNNFVMVSNAFVENFDVILRGNERVLKARLCDAEFFYNNDVACKMDFGSLDNVLFMQDAGSLSQKVKQEKAVAMGVISILLDKSLHSQKILQDLNLTLDLAKKDLLSQSVGEFPGLQGIMGAYFAKNMGVKDEICVALKEQYLPHGTDSSLPSTRFSAIVNLAIKLDNIFTLFNLNKIPTGSKDPFSLRRQVAGMLRICHAFGFDFSVDDVCNLSKNAYKNIDLHTLKHFINERVFGIFADVNPSIIRSVLKLDSGIASSFEKIITLERYFKTADIKAVISTFKRVANILDSKVLECKIDEELFGSTERDLYKKLLDYKAVSESFTDYFERLQNLFLLKNSLDRVFNEVLINVENVTLKQNRVALISLVFQEFLFFGDLREMSVS